MSNGKPRMDLVREEIRVLQIVCIDILDQPDPARPGIDTAFHTDPMRTPVRTHLRLARTQSAATGKSLGFAATTHRTASQPLDSYRTPL